MTCVAVCHLERPVLICAEITFCYCFNFIINIIVYVWQWASCQPQCPPSQFHCPLCNHMGALRHFSTLFESTEPRMHCEEQHKVEATLPESPLDVCLWWICISSSYSGTRACKINVVLVFLRNIFTSSTALWLNRGKQKWRFLCSFIKGRKKEKKSEEAELKYGDVNCNVRFSVAQQGNSTDGEEKYV